MRKLYKRSLNTITIGNRRLYFAFLKNNFMEIANDITSLVGNTPLVKLNRIRKYFDCYPEIIAKLESFNPSASVKDRIAYSMLCKAEEELSLIHI